MKRMVVLGGLFLLMMSVTVFVPFGSMATAAGDGAKYAGMDSCKECHTKIYDTFKKSGHPYKLNKVVDGKPPTYPFTQVTELPKGVTWDDVSYVIGGYNWKYRFVGKDGFIITGSSGDKSYLNQFNFANQIVGTDAGWAKYHPGEKRPYNCGRCHTTGYNPEGHQDGLPGMVGTWAEPGITCERFHGPGSKHNADPYGVKLRVDRDSAQCGQCHRRGSIEAVNAKGGFIRHHEQYEELFQSKHVIIDCVVCHDPHASVIQLRKTGQPTTRTKCENCHYQEAKFRDKIHLTNNVGCIDCHMPRITKSAVGNKKKFTGDIRTHMMGIDYDQFGQFTKDGKNALSQLGLDFACKSCHYEGGKAKFFSNKDLRETAFNYHKRPDVLPTDVPSMTE
jgi:hypothetical protein